MPTNIEECELQKLLTIVTGIPANISISLLKFLREFDGIIAGSCSLAMYLEKLNKRTFKPEDIDIYIPVLNSKINRLGGQNIDNLSVDIINNDISKLPEYNEKKNIDWLYIVNKFISYFVLYLGIYKIGGIKTNYQQNKINAIRNKGLTPWNKIVDFEPNNRILEVDNLNLPYIQLIFINSDLDISNFINKNYDFYAVKVYTTFNSEIKILPKISKTVNNQNPYLVVIDELYIKNKILNIPRNWSSITLLACFKTVTYRFIKYTKRGFIPHNYKLQKDIDLISAYNEYIADLETYLFIKIVNERNSKKKLNSHRADEYIMDIDEIIQDCELMITELDFFDNIQKTLIDNQSKYDIRSKINITNENKIILKRILLNFLNNINRTAIHVYTELSSIKNTNQLSFINMIEEELKIEEESNNNNAENIETILTEVRYINNKKFEPLLPKGPAKKVAEFILKPSIFTKSVGRSKKRRKIN